MHPGVESLVSTYRDIVQPRMSSLPMFNQALRVEAVDFQPHQDRAYGVIITPWFMNLVVLPAEDDDWKRWRQENQSNCLSLGAIMNARPASWRAWGRTWPCHCSPRSRTSRTRTPQYASPGTYCNACAAITTILLRTPAKLPSPAKADGHGPCRAGICCWASPGPGSKTRPFRQPRSPGINRYPGAANPEALAYNSETPSTGSRDMDTWWRYTSSG